MFYEPGSGFYVAQSRPGSSGTSMIEGVQIDLLTPGGVALRVPLERLPEAQRVLFNEALEVGSTAPPPAPIVPLDQPLMVTPEVPPQPEPEIPPEPEPEQPPQPEPEIPPTEPTPPEEDVPVEIPAGGGGGGATPPPTVLTASLEDSLSGEDASDSFSGTASHWHSTDTVDGGAGADTLTISSGAVDVNLGAGFYENVQSIETLVLPDAAHRITVDDAYFNRGGGLENDRLQIDATASTQALTVDGSGIADSAHTLDIDAGSGNDTLQGGAGRDAIDGGAGDDQITISWPASATTQTPDQIAAGNLLLWLDANDLDGDGTAEGAGEAGLTGSDVSAWRDKSGNAHDLDAVSGAPQYVTNHINGTAVVTFDGNDFLEDADAAAYLDGLNDVSIFAVIAADALQDTGFFRTDNTNGTDDGLGIRYDSVGFNGGAANTMKFGDGGTALANYEGAANIQTTDAQLVNLVRATGSNMQLFLNGVADSPSDITGATTTAIGGVDFLRIGDHGKGGWDGDVAEILIYQTALTAAQRIEVERYIESKYGIDTPQNLIATASADTVEGGAGIDTLVVNGAAMTLTLDGSNHLSGIEIFDLTGNDAAHQLAFADGYVSAGSGISGGAITVNLTGNATAATLDGSAVSAGTAFTLQGGAGDDSLQGGAGADSLVGAGGNDTLHGGMGNDSFSSGAGDDLMEGGAGEDYFAVEWTNTGDAGLLITGNRVIHLDASDTANVTPANGTVTLWNDLSPDNNDATNSQGAAISGAQTINGRNAIAFDGNSALVVANDNDINLDVAAERSIFIAFQTGADVTTRQVIYEQGGQTNGFAIYIANGNLYAAAWRSNNGDFGFYQNLGSVTANTAYTSGLVFDNATTNQMRSYLNGVQTATADTIPVDQAGHSGSIGIGGAIGDTRTEAGGFGGNGLYFNGRIGELLNYNDALTALEAINLSNYLGSKWISTAAGGDTVVGGAGIDTLAVSGEAVSQVLDDDGQIEQIERIDLTGADAAHRFTVTESYFTNLSGEWLSIDGGGNSTGINVSAVGVSTPHGISVTLTGGNDTVTGGQGIDRVSFEGATTAITVDLSAETATGAGSDSLSSVEWIIGSAQGDSLLGSSVNNTLDGGDGNDTISGAKTGSLGGLVTDNIAFHLDASNTASIVGHPGAITRWNDLGALNNDAVDGPGSAISGATTINGRNSIRFDGDDTLNIANSGDINTGTLTARSIFAVFETGADVTSRQFIYEQGGTGNGYSMYIFDGNLYLAAWRGGGGTFGVYDAGAVQANTSYVAGLVFDRQFDNDFTTYLNGEVLNTTAITQDQGSHSGGIGVGGVNGNSLHESGGSGGGQNFVGELGELINYRDVLSDQEVEQLTFYLADKWGVNDAMAASDDRLIGGLGNDCITGGLGEDCITGGMGDDLFVFETIRDSGVGAGNRDIITDFNNTTEADRIVLSGMDAAPFVAVSADGTAGAGLADFTATGNAEVAWAQVGGNTIIYLDEDGDGAADAELQLTGELSLSGGDFVFS